jgi:hypothetical protein
MSRNKNPQFAMLPFKLSRLGLTPFEIATYYVLRMYADKNGKGARPSWETLCSDAGMKRTQLYHSLKGLRDCGIIAWESGWKGHPSRYEFLPVGRWAARKGFTTRTINEPEAEQHMVHHLNGVVQETGFYGSPPEHDLDPDLDPLSRLGETFAIARDIPREPTESEILDRRQMLLNQAKQLARGNQ